MHIIVILALVIVAWAAVEWMFFKEVVRTWRDSKIKRSAKICAVVMACIDIPLAWLSPYAAVLLGAGFRTPNGYCLHFANYHGDVLSDALSMVYTLLLAPVQASFSGLLGVSLVGSVGVEILFDFETYAGAGEFAANFAVMVFCLAMAFYFLAGGFLRGKNAWRASDRLKWKAILIFFATYWPSAFWIQLLKVAEATANATGHCCFDL
jgi:hypothetical protein